MLLLAINSGTESDKFFKKDDNIATLAGEWIAKQAYFNPANTVFNDPVVAFYAGIDLSFTGREETALYLNGDDKKFSFIEDYATMRKADLVVIYLRKERIEEMARFNNFIKIKEFESGNKVVAVYSSVAQYHKMAPHY
jgi:hypothetical protein